MAGEESFASLSFFIFALSRHFVQPCILILRDLPTPPSLLYDHHYHHHIRHNPHHPCHLDNN